MRHGRIDRRVALQRKTKTVDISGQVTETWATLSVRWASVAPVSGDERFAVPQIGARQQTEFQVRWSAAIADLSPLDRTVYPVPPATSPPTPVPGTSVFDISAVHEVGRREALRIIAERHTDT
jgi:head-tail adaptor